MAGPVIIVERAQQQRSGLGKPPIILGHTEIGQVTETVAVKSGGELVQYKRVRWDPTGKGERVCTYYTPEGGKPGDHPHVTVECKPDGSLVSLHYEMEKDHAIWYAVKGEEGEPAGSGKLTVSNQLKANPEKLKIATERFIDFLQQSGVHLDSIPSVSNFP